MVVAIAAIEVSVGCDGCGGRRGDTGAYADATRFRGRARHCGECGDGGNRQNKVFHPRSLSLNLDPQTELGFQISIAGVRLKARLRVARRRLCARHHSRFRLGVLRRLPVTLAFVADRRDRRLNEDHRASPCGPRIDALTPRVLLVIGCIATLSPAFAQEAPTAALTRLSLPVAGDPPGETCRRIESPGAPLGMVSLHRTFHDDFDEHPLSRGKWAPHYAGGAAWPEARYWGGDGSDFKRKTIS